MKKKEIASVAVAGLIAFMICFGFGYFFGRYVQVQKNRALLEVIPDINCGR
jgi:hypothetical protein